MTTYRRPAVFKTLLVLVTVLPISIAFAFPLGIASGSSFPGQHYLFLMTFVSVAHVPSTLYLLHDRNLIGQPDISSRKMVVVPLFFVVTFPIVILFLGSRAEDGPSLILYVIWVSYFMWQHWHFGRQNLGVVTFCLMGPGGRRISNFERLTISLASFSGVLAVCGRYAQAMKVKYLNDSPFALHDFIATWAFDAGMALQMGISVASLIYLGLYRRSYSPLTAIIYLCSVSYFLPMYFEPGFILPHYAAGHGLQYMVFLAFHALAMSGGKEEKSPGAGSASRIVAPCLLVIVFLLGGFYHVASESISTFLSLVADTSGLSSLTPSRALLLLVGLDMGVTCAHFWYDSIFWKLRVPERRKWAASRYSFLFP